MRTKLSVWIKRTIFVGITYGFLETGGCVGDVQREMEVLFAPEANPTLIRDSLVYQNFGPGFLQFWKDFW